MKVEEMADLLESLASTLDKFLAKPAVNDLRSVGQCFRTFSGESVSSFCTFIQNAKTGSTVSRKSSPKPSAARVEEFVGKIQNFLDNRRAFGYSAIRDLVAEIGKLTIPEIKAIGNRIECPLSEKTKGEILVRLENWLSNIKLSAEQSSFSSVGGGT